MTDFRCRLFGHKAEVMVLDGGALRVRCIWCNWTSPGHLHIPPPKITTNGHHTHREWVLRLLKAKASA